jgi:hypothetical protein
MITFQYLTDKNISRKYESDETYLVVQDSGKKLGVQRIEYFGPLVSESKGKMTGWFISARELIWSKLTNRTSARDDGIKSLK